MGEQPTGNSWVMPIAEGMGTVPLGVIECHALFQMGAGRQELTNPQPRAALHMVRFDEQVWVLGLLRDGEHLVCQRARRLVLRPHGIIERQAAERGEDLLPVSDLLTEFPRAAVGVFHLWRGKALGRSQQCTQGQLQGEFLLRALRAYRARSSAAPSLW